jgi:DUF971 family protein
VQIAAIEPVGTYAIKLTFSDGHDTGLYSWDYLYEIGRNQVRLATLSERMREAGASRDAAGAVRPHRWSA